MDTATYLIYFAVCSFERPTTVVARAAFLCGDMVAGNVHHRSNGRTLAELVVLVSPYFVSRLEYPSLENRPTGGGIIVGYTAVVHGVVRVYCIASTVVPRVYHVQHGTHRSILVVA